MSSRKSRKSTNSNSDKPSRSRKTPRSDSSEGSLFESEESESHATWECTACTYANRFEAFSCEICGTRKGTSTRKPRLNPSVVQQQALAQALALSQEKEKRRVQRNSGRVEKNAGSSRPSSAASSHKKSPTREALSPVSTGSHDNDELAAVLTMHKKDKIRNNLINRDAAVEYEVRDVNNVDVKITVFPSKYEESELRMIQVLREEDAREKLRVAKISDARKLYDERRQQFCEARQKQRDERFKHGKERRSRDHFTNMFPRVRKGPGRKPKNGTPGSSNTARKHSPKPRGRPSTGKPLGRPRNPTPLVASSSNVVIKKR